MKIFHIFCIILYIPLIATEKSNYKSYQNREIVTIINSKGKTIVNGCFITSLPNGFQKPQKEENVEFSKLYYSANFDLCDTANLSLNGYESAAVTVSPRCGMIQQKTNARSLNIKILLYLIKQELALPDIYSELSKDPAVILMPMKLLNLTVVQSNDLKIGIYGLTNNRIDSLFSPVIICALVLITILIMMCLTVCYSKDIIRANDAMDISSISGIKYMAIILPISMIGLLLLVYFFYSVMVWVMIIAFYFLSAMCLTNIFALFIERRICLLHLRKTFNRCGFQYIDGRYIAIFVIGLIISTTWIICRNNTVGLVLNNVMGVYICIQIAINFGVLFVAGRNFKVVLVIMVTIIILDVVMVYAPIKDSRPETWQQLPLAISREKISRLRRDSHGSIMESIATAMSGSQQEELPIRFKIPRIKIGYDSSFATCTVITGEYTMIGFGDLILPGAFIVHMLIFAVIGHKNVVLYFLVTFFSYSVGLLLTYVTVILTMKGQPALVFLLPCTIVPTLLLSVIRGDFMTLWSGTWLSAQIDDGFSEVHQNMDDNINNPTLTVIA